MKRVIRKLNKDIERARMGKRSPPRAQTEGIDGYVVRHVGDVVIFIRFNDDDTYSGFAEVDGSMSGTPMIHRGRRSYPFEGLRAPPIGLGPGVAYDSDKAYDKMVKALASFLAHDHEELEEALYMGHDGDDFVVRRRG